MALSRAISKLPPELESLVEQTIGALLAVHRELGSGRSEKVYCAATEIEFEERGISFERERTYPIHYRGRLIGHQRVDLFVDGRLVVEIKSVERLHPAHISQVVRYLRETGAPIGLLVNFNVPLLAQGLRRVVS